MTKLFILALTSYCFASVTFLLALLGKKESLNLPTKIFEFFGFAILNIILLITLTADTLFSQGSLYVFLLAWLLSAVTLFTWYKMKNAILFLATAPINFLLIHTGMIRYNGLSSQVDTIYAGAIFNVHIISLLLAIIILFTAGIAGILFLTQDKAMKLKKVGQYKHLPPLDLLDKINYYATCIGFPAYTLGVLCGFLWAYSSWGTFFSADIKEIFSLLIWAGYAFLFHMRVGLSMKGRKPAMLIILLSLLSLFSLLAVNTLFETHHQF